MVAIVSGNDLGLSLSSWSVLGARGTVGNANAGRYGDQVYVNAATGNLILQGRDELLMGRGLDAAALRTYNSQGVFDDDNADNWGSGIYRQQLTLEGGWGAAGSRLVRVGRDGAMALYTWDAEQAGYISTAGAGAYDRIHRDGSNYVWTDGSTGDLERYDVAMGRLISLADAKGNVVELTYDAQGNLSSMRSANGETLYYDYTGNQLMQLRIVTADGKTLTGTRYGYDGQGRLVTVTVDLSPEDNSVSDGKTFVTTYKYKDTPAAPDKGIPNPVYTHFVASIEQSDGTSVVFQYDSQNRIVSVRNGLGLVLSLTYQAGATKVVDGLGYETRYDYDAAGQLTGVTTPTVNGVAGSTKYEYTATGDLARVVDAEGRTIEYGYDARGNQLWQRDSLGNTIERSYDAANRLQSETVYLVPDPDGTGVARPQAPQTSRYVYDAAGKGLLRFEISASGEVVEHRYSAYGERTSTHQYLSRNVDAAGVTVDPAQLTEAALEGWVDQQDKTRGTRVDMRYDERGQLQRQVRYTALDASGTGVLNGEEQVSHYVYDMRGQLLQVLDGAKGNITYTYDGLGRVLTTTDGLNQTTLCSYDDAGMSVRLTAPNGLVAVNSYDKAGRLVSVTQSGAAGSLGTTRNFYDDNDRLYMTEDATGSKNWFLYDEAGRKVGEVDANGSLTEYRYNRAGQLIQKVSYATPLIDFRLEAGHVTPLNAIRPAASSQDQTTWMLYDAAGRASKTVDAYGYVSETRYDGASRVVATLRYARPIDMAAFKLAPTLANATPAADAACDRLTRSFYDAQGRLVGTLDAEGFLTEHLYDAAGRLVKQQRHETSVDTALRAVGSLDDIRPKTSLRVFYQTGNNSSALQHLGSFKAGDVVTASVRFKAAPDTTGMVFLGDTTGPNPYSNMVQSLPRYGNDGWQTITVSLTLKEDEELYLFMYGDRDSVTKKVGNYVDYTDVVVSSVQRGLVLADDFSSGSLGNWDVTSYSQINSSVNTYYLRDGAGQVQGEVDAGGYLTEYVYDARGNMTQRIRYATALSPSQLATLHAETKVASIRPISTAGAQSTRWEYDVLNRQSKQTDAYGTVTSFEYNAAGQITKTVQALGTAEARTLTSRYDLQGRLTGELSAEGAALLTDGQTQDQIDAIWALHGTLYTYDAAGRRTSQTVNDGTQALRTLYFYSADGLLTHTINPLGEVEERQYDGLNQLVRVLNYGGRLSANTLAGLSGGLTNTAIQTAIQELLAQRTVANLPYAHARTEYSYDVRGQLASAKDASGNTTDYSYTAFGERNLVLRAYGAQGAETGQYFTYDRRGLLVEQLDDDMGLRAKTSYRYDAFGRRIAQVDPRGVAQSWEYDRLGRVVQTQDNLGFKRQTSYDAFARVFQQTDAHGHISTYAYDDAARSTRLTRPEGDREVTVLNRHGQLESKTDGNGRVTRNSYDRNGRVTAISHPLAGSSNEYDNLGRVRKSTDAAGVVTRYTYDELGRLLTRTVDEGGLNLLTRYEYADTSTGTSVITTEPGGLQTLQEFDVKGQLTCSVVDANGAKITTRYTYDAQGHTLSVSDPNGTVTVYTYDALGRRTSELRDPNGLKLQRSYEYDLSNNLVASTDANGNRTVYAYDGKNQLVYEVNALGQVRYTEYDREGRELRVTQFAQAISLSGLHATPSSAEIASRVQASPGQDRAQAKVYDPDGRLVYTVDASGAVVHFAYDGNRNVRERRAYATPIDYANWVLGKEPVVVADAARDRLETYTYDALNRQTSAQVELAGSKLITRFEYDKQGNQTRVTDAMGNQTRYVYDAVGRLRYTLDAEYGLTERLYDKQGRLLQTIGYADRQMGINTVVDAEGRVTNSMGAVVANAEQDRVNSYIYDAAGRQIYSVDAEAGVTRNLYDANGNVIERYEFAWDLPGTKPALLQGLKTAAAQGLLTAENLGSIPPQSAHDRRTAYRYDAANRLRYEYDAENYVTETRYDRATTTTIRYATRSTGVDQVPVPHADDRASVRIVDAAGRLWRSIDAMGVETRLSYDGLGQLVRQTQAYGLSEAVSTRYAYDAAGRQVAKTEADGTTAAATTRYEYNVLGQLLCEIESRGVALSESDGAWAQGERVRLGYPSGLGALTAAHKQALRDQFSARHEYDQAGRRTATINAQGAITRTQYDAAGNAIKVTDPLGHEGYSYYDKLNRVALQVDPEGYATRTSYAVGGGENRVTEVRRYFTKVSATVGQPPTLVEHVRDAVSRNTYDRLNRLLSATDAEGHTESTRYAMARSRFARSAINKLGGFVGYRTDRLGRTTVESMGFSGRSILNRYSYNAFGERIESIEAAGQPEQRVTTFGYDKAGRLTHRIGSAYDAFDVDQQLTRSVRPAEFTRYDALGRAVENVVRGQWDGSVVQGGQRSLTYYDAAGRKTARITADGALTRYEYDPTGAVIKESAMATRIGLPTQAGGSPPDAPADLQNDRVTRYRYDNLGRLIFKSRDAVLYFETQYGQSDISVTPPTPSTVVLEQFVYDAAGNVVQELDGRGNSVYNYYDRLGRKVLRIDQEGYATSWDFGDISDVATTQTRYAQRVPQYGRQDDRSAPQSWRDPAQLRAGLSLQAARTTTYALDRLGRVVEQRVLGVKSSTVLSDGTMSETVSDAITYSQYNGLGLLTQTRQLADHAGGGNSPQRWLQTDIEYDALGREVSRLEPGYVDVAGQDVRPQTQIEYNGLGAQTRVIRRGTDSTSELDDRITSYGYNANGERIRVTDAMGAVTDLELNEQGYVARSISRAVVDAEGNRTDVVRQFGYDAMGRIVLEREDSTGTRRLYRHNAFGELTGKGMGQGDYHELIEYNTLGKAQRSNSGNGSTRLFLYDRNGNATREIFSNDVDLSTVSLQSAASDGRLSHRFSVFDKRNQLVQTIEPRMEAMKSTSVSNTGAFTERSVELSGDLKLDQSGGGVYVPGSPTGGTGFPVEVITGGGVPYPAPRTNSSGNFSLGSVSPSGALSLNNPNVPRLGAAWDMGSKSIRPLPTVQAPAVPVSGFEVPISDVGETYANPGYYPQVKGPIYIPNRWPSSPDFKYVIVTSTHWGESRKVVSPGQIYYYEPQNEKSLRILAEFNDGQVVELARANIYYDVDQGAGPPVLGGPSTPEQSDILRWSVEFEYPSTRWIIFTADAAKPYEVSVNGQALAVYRRGAYGLVQVPTSALQGGGTTTLSVRGGTGPDLVASNYTLRMAGNELVMDRLAAVSVEKPEVFVDGTNVLRAPAFPGAASIYARRQGSGESWQNFPLSTPWSGGAGDWEFILQSGEANIYGTLTCAASGAVSMSGALYDVRALSPSLTVNVGAPSAFDAGRPREMTLTVGGIALGTYSVAANGDVTIPWDGLRNLGIDRFSVRSLTYGAEVYTVTSAGRVRTGALAGVLQLSPDGSGAGRNSATLSPAAWLRLTGAAKLSGNVEVSRGGAFLGSIALGNTNICQLDGQDAWLDLSAFTGGSGQLDLRFRSAQDAFSVTVGHADGRIGAVTSTPAYYGVVKAGISIDGLDETCDVTFVVKRASGQAWTPSRTKIEGSVFSWDVPWEETAGLGEHTFSFTVTRAGAVISQGQGTFKAGETSGVVVSPSFSMGSTPTWSTTIRRPGTVGLDIPGATLLDVDLYRQGSSTPWKRLSLNAADGRFAWEIAPEDVGSYTFQYSARAAAGQVVGKGSGSYVVDTDGKVTMQVGSDKRPAALDFILPGDAQRLEFRLWKKGAPTPLVLDQVLFKDSNWQIHMPEGLAPGDYEYSFVARNRDGKDGVEGDIVGRGHGSFKASANGPLMDHQNVRERLPLGSLTFNLARGRTGGTHLRLTLTPEGGGAVREVIVAGRWSETPPPGGMSYVWTRPFGDEVIDTERRFTCVAEVLNSQGQVLLDETGEALSFRDLALIVAPADQNKESSARFVQKTKVLNLSAQVSTQLSYNAFGEISEEFDQRVFERALAMTQLYAKEGLGQFSADATLARTRFEYNTLGKLIEKRDAQTFETLANGGVRRVNPTTRYGYDLLGRVVSLTDANGNQRRQTYAGASERQITRQWAGDNGLKRYEFDIFGDTRRQINELSVVTALDYDKLSRLVMQTRQGVTRVDNFRAQEFDGVQTVAGALIDRFEYDELGRRIKQIDALQRVRTTWYDALDRVTGTSLDNANSTEGYFTHYEYRYVAAGASDGDAIFGAGGRSVGGYVVATLGADGLQQIDRFDYFNNKSSRVDLGGNRYQYRYNHAGLLAGQTSSLGQNIVYNYVGNGLIESIRDLAGHSITQYAYDDAGNRIREMYGKLSENGLTEELVYQSSALQYDELGRLARVSDVLGGDDGNSQKSHIIRHEYDAVGNRRAVIAQYWDPATRNFLQRDDNWYLYDAANRFTTTMGSLAGERGVAGTQIVLGPRGKAVEYDAMGQRTAVTQADGKREEYRYSSDGYLEDVLLNGRLSARRRIDAVGRTVQYREWAADGAIRQTKVSSYTIDGRLTREVVSDTQDSNGRTDYYYYVDGTGNDQGGVWTYGAGALARTVHTSEPKEGDPVVTGTFYKYVYLDSAKQAEVKVKAHHEEAPNWAPGFSRFSYDVNGHLKEAAATDGRRLQYHNNAEGLTLLRTESFNGKETDLRRSYFFANGRQVGDVSTDPRDRDRRLSYGDELAQPLTPSEKPQERYRNLKPITSADFDQNYEPINSRYPEATAGSYTVQRGDTLQNIALAIWGDSAMWYLIAETNGLTVDGTTLLEEKLVLTIPNKVTNIHNNASTFRPYNPGEAMGRVDPMLPDPPPPPKGDGCGGIGTALMIVVAVVVTIYTAGAAASSLASGATFSTSAGVATVGSASTFSTGLATLSGGLVGASGASVLGATIGSAAIGAAAGSIASQLTGLATGVIDQFSWKAVGQAALSGGITAGMGNVLNSLGSTAGTLGGAVNQKGWAGAAIRAGLGSAVSQAMQGRWSWREVAASTVAGAAGHAAGEAIGSAFAAGGHETLGKIAGQALGAAAGGWASSQILGYSGEQTRARMGQAFISGLAGGIGNAIGDSFAYGGNSGSSGSSGSSSYQDGGIGRSELRFKDGPAPSFPTFSQLADGGGFGDGSVQPVDRSGDIQLAAAKGYDGIGLGQAMPGDEPGTVQFNTLRGSEYRKRINFDGTTQEYYVLDPVEVTGKSLRSLSASAAPRVLTMPAMDSSVSFLQAADLAPLSGGVTLQDFAPLPTLAMSLQAGNDAKAIAGTLNIYGEAWDAARQGSWSQAWAHLNYEPSDAARAAVYARVFPQASPNLTRIDTMAASPWGATASLIGRAFGASQQRQDALLQTGALLENGAGAATGIYKQTLTAPPPMPTQLARVRGSLVNDLKRFESESLQFGNNTYLLDKRGMKHILERHHPDYWAGENKQMQTFLDASMSIPDVANVAREVMKQNRDLLAKQYKPFGQIEGTVGGVDYVLGLSRGRVGQLYPKQD